MSIEGVTTKGKNGKWYCKHCGVLWDFYLDAVIWKLKFLSSAFGSFGRNDEFQMGKDEAYGVMAILDDITRDMRLKGDDSETEEDKD